MPAFKKDKLRSNLRLAMSRFKLLEKKKTEQAMKARKEIADYIKADRIERARIRVEHIVREDYMVEAYEVLETYCDLILARFSLLDTMEYCEESLLTPVSTLIWAEPRVSADVQEMKEVSLQLSKKFGKKFAEMAITNQSEQVNPKVMHRMGLNIPPRRLVESYMKEIAKNYNVDYEPDESAFLDEDEPVNEKDFLPRPDDEPRSGPNPPYNPGPPGNGSGPYNPQNLPHPPSHNPQNAYPPNPGPSLPPYSSNPNPEPLPYPQQPGGMPQPQQQEQGGFDFPAVPTMNPVANDRDLDYDDLAERFKRLKEKK